MSEHENLTVNTNLLAGISISDQMYYLVTVDKDYHAVHAVLAQPSLEAIRAIVADEIRKALAEKGEAQS